MTKLRRLTIIAMLVAMNVVLSILTPVKLNNFKFTFEAFPILVGAMLYGPLEGLAVGGLGSFIYQMFFSGYGITPTIPLWILPHAASGLLVGLLAKAKKFKLSSTQASIIAAISALLVTALNTLALYVDSKMFGYYSKKLVFASIPFKIIAGIVLAIIYGILIPQILKRVENIK